MLNTRARPTRFGGRAPSADGAIGGRPRASLLDHARARVLARAGARFQERMEARVMSAILTRVGRSPAARSAPATGLHDLEAMQRFASSPGPFAFFDAPWTPAFLFVLFTFHWLLGALAVVSGLLLVGLALMNSARTARLQAAAGETAARAGHFVEQLGAGAETVRGLGMRTPATARGGAPGRRAEGHGGGLGPGRRLCGGRPSGCRAERGLCRTEDCGSNGN